MARHKEFDQHVALNKAMQLFRRCGYEATSMQDLVDQMGIGRGSLYDTFGDKHQLYLAALDCYQQQGHRTFEPLHQPGPIKQRIAQMFDNLIEEAVTDVCHSGCFMTNAIVELASNDHAVAERAIAALSGIEQNLWHILNQAQQNGEIEATCDIRALAQFFLNTILGLRVLTKVNPQCQTLRNIVTIALSVLD